MHCQCLFGGVNAGVILMNLTRLRNQKWVKKIMDYYEEFRREVKYGDQDLINIFFHHHPGKLHILVPNWVSR